MADKLTAEQLEFVKQLNIKPADVTRLRSLQRALDAFEKALQKTDKPTQKLARDTIGAQTDYCVDLIAGLLGIPIADAKKKTFDLLNLPHDRLHRASETSIANLSRLLGGKP